MNVENWNWAVWVFLVLEVMTFMVRCANHGRPGRTVDARDAAINISASIALLYFGGFFA